MVEQATGRAFVDVLMERARGIRYAQLPDEVCTAARHALVDSFAVMLAGSAEPEIGSLGREVAARAGSSEATLLGLSERADAATAALVNGTAGVWHDFDSGNRWLGGHPSAHTVPAALAVAEREGASGPALLEAIVTGYELAARIGLCVELRPGMHPHGTWVVPGAAAAVALLMEPGNADLMRETILAAVALPLATSFPAAFEGATVRNVFAGAGAANAVLAADLAAAGMRGPSDAIEDVYSRVAGVGFHPERASDAPEWMILRGYHKLRACARYLHPALDALDDALEHAGHVEADDIESIDVQTFQFAATMDDPAPENPLAARFSAPFALATSIVREGETGVDAFAPSALGDATTRALSTRVRVDSDPEAERGVPHRRPARVTVHLRDGRTLAAGVEQARGEPDGAAPVQAVEVRSKFVTCASRALGPRGAERLLEALDGIDEVDDIASISALAHP